MKKLLLVACMAFAAVLLSSCGSTKVEAEVAAPNYEGAWVVEEFVKDGTVVTGATANLEIVAPKDGVYKVAGKSGVNQFFGDYTITADTIAPVNAAGNGVTKMAGLPEAMAYEDAFLAVMNSSNKIALVEGKLVISNDTAKITFVAGAPAAMPIEGEEAPAEIEE